MTTIQFRKPVARPLHPFEWSRPAGNHDFRITQHFGDLDSYWSNADPAKAKQLHRATDIGNTLCGDVLVAMAPGTVLAHLEDNATAYGAPTNALGVAIDHGFGIVIAYWHVMRILLPVGAKVEAGTPVALLGKTGLGQVCHAHITGKRFGVLFDVEPLMFGGTLTVGPEVEDDMLIKGKFLRHVGNKKVALTSDAHFRAGVNTGDDESLGVLLAGEEFIPTVCVAGRAVGTSADRQEWYGGIKTSSKNGQIDAPTFGYVHASVLPRTADRTGVEFERIETVIGEAPAPVPVDCTPQINAAVVGERKRWEDWMKGAPQG